MTSRDMARSALLGVIAYRAKMQDFAYCGPRPIGCWYGWGRLRLCPWDASDEAVKIHGVLHVPHWVVVENFRGYLYLPAGETPSERHVDDVARWWGSV